MPVDLEELARIVEAAIGDTKVDAKVLGVTPGEGEGCYAEVLVAMGGNLEQRISIGVQRDAPPAALRAQIVEALETGPDSNRGRS